MSATKQQQPEPPTSHEQAEQPQEPQTPEQAEQVAMAVSRMPTAEIRCGACDETLVSIARTPTAAAILHVYERQVLRPHTLREEELPLDWRCAKCGAPTTIGA